ncbi:protein [Escherichia coli]|uniref:Protein n=1 Tax=Escherichia coli TaxID=562 RepID=A0A376TKX1_ECOLX|nr:protein [Escherichia coli]
MVTRTYLTGKFVAHWSFSPQQNQWDLSNYDTFDMKALGEDSYRDLSGIGIPVAKKCKALARDSLSLLAYVK